MAFVTSLAGVDLEQVDTTPKYALGSIIETSDGQYQYVKHALSGAITAGLIYKISSAFVTVLLTTAVSGDVPTNAVAFQIEVGAGNTTAQYAWAFSGFGNFNASVATSISAGAALTTTTSAGVLGASGDAVGAAAVGETSAGAAVIACYAPGKLKTNA